MPSRPSSSLARRCRSSRSASSRGGLSTRAYPRGACARAARAAAASTSEARGGPAGAVDIQCRDPSGILINGVLYGQACANNPPCGKQMALVPQPRSCGKPPLSERLMLSNNRSAAKAALRGPRCASLMPDSRRARGRPPREHVSHPHRAAADGAAGGGGHAAKKRGGGIAGAATKGGAGVAGKARQGGGGGGGGRQAGFGGLMNRLASGVATSKQHQGLGGRAGGGGGGAAAAGGHAGGAHHTEQHQHRSSVTLGLKTQ